MRDSLYQMRMQNKRLFDAPLLKRFCLGLLLWANVATLGWAQGYGQLYREGVLVATVQPDGWLVDAQGGGFIGRVEARGDVFREGQLVGRFDPSGAVLGEHGQLLGQLDASGQVIRAGLPVGRIDANGQVYESGRMIGQAQDVNPRVVAAYFFFFFHRAGAAER